MRPESESVVSQSFRLSYMSSTAVFALLTYVFFWNVATVPGSPVKFSERGRSVGEFLGLDQEWRMFAPFPDKNDGWYVIPGKLKNGAAVDLFNQGKPVTWEKPKLVSATFKNFRWQKYLTNIRSQDHAEYRIYYAKYLCHDWNRRHLGDSQLESLELTYVLEHTLPDYGYSTPTKYRVFTHRCGSGRVDP